MNKVEVKIPLERWKLDPRSLWHTLPKTQRPSQSDLIFCFLECSQCLCIDIREAGMQFVLVHYCL